MRAKLAAENKAFDRKWKRINCCLRACEQTGSAVCGERFASKVEVAVGRSQYHPR